jgi:hypothetical protein
MSQELTQLRRPPAVEINGETVRQFLKRHRSPSTLFPVERCQIVSELRAGRNVEQTATAYHAQPHVCLELWLRKLDRELISLRDMYTERIA